MTKVINILKQTFFAVINFFKQKNAATKSCLSNLDIIEIIIALSPAAIFGCLLFGLRALFTLVICITVCIATDIVWNVILKKENKGINCHAALTGLLLALTLSSALNIIFTILLCVLVTTLTKTVFNNKTHYIAFPVLVIRVLFTIIFFEAFSQYLLPFINTPSASLPLFSDSSFVYPAKYLFFGLHSGNIGETSVFLILLGGIYLMLRKIINPVIPVSFIVTSFLLSLIFGENIAASLMGGGLFFAAMFLTIDYSFKTTPLYKKILYGFVCGLFTFVLRLLFKTESTLLAVLIADLIFIVFTRRNIKRIIAFIKNFSFKKIKTYF